MEPSDLAIWLTVLTGLVNTVLTLVNRIKIGALRKTVNSAIDLVEGIQLMSVSAPSEKALGGPV